MTVKAKWSALRGKHVMESATDAYLFFSDCNETDSGINEPVTLAESKDFGQDKLTALSLLQRHKHLQNKTQSIEGNVHELKRTDETLRSARRRCTGPPTLPRQRSPRS